jgi:hypothetical protein
VVLSTGEKVASLHERRMHVLFLEPASSTATINKRKGRGTYKKMGCAYLMD